jgi:hypothetical protein
MADALDLAGYLVETTMRLIKYSVARPKPVGGSYSDRGNQDMKLFK